jgi:hypothetical protein
MTIPHISLFGYRFLRLKFTGGVQYQMYFMITDEKVTKSRWLWWYQDIPGRTQAALDFSGLGEPGYHLKVETLGNDRAPATEFTLADKTVNLDNIVTDIAAKVGIAQIGKFGGMAVRLIQEPGHHMILKFGGSPPADLLGKNFTGQMRTWFPTQKFNARTPGLPADT